MHEFAENQDMNGSTAPQVSYHATQHVLLAKLDAAGKGRGKLARSLEIQ